MPDQGRNTVSCIGSPAERFPSLRMLGVSANFRAVAINRAKNENKIDPT